MYLYFWNLTDSSEQLSHISNWDCSIRKEVHDTEIKSF